MMSTMGFYACIVTCALATLSQAPTQAMAGRILYRQKLDGGQELVIEQTSIVPLTVFSGLIPSSIINRTINAPTGLFAITVELKSDLNPTLVLWSERYAVHGERLNEYNAYRILDVAVLPNRIVFVLASAMHQLSVQEIVITGKNRSAVLALPVDWGLATQATSTSNTGLSAKLVSDEQNRCVEVEIIDLVEDVKLHTSFKQKHNVWEFESVKQWREE